MCVDLFHSILVGWKSIFIAAGSEPTGQGQYALCLRSRGNIQWFPLQKLKELSLSQWTIWKTTTNRNVMVAYGINRLRSLCTINTRFYNGTELGLTDPNNLVFRLWSPPQKQYKEYFIRRRTRAPLQTLRCKRRNGTWVFQCPRLQNTF